MELNGFDYFELKKRHLRGDILQNESWKKLKRVKRKRSTVTKMVLRVNDSFDSAKWSDNDASCIKVDLGS